jgi:hypothetical protein
MGYFQSYETKMCHFPIGRIMPKMFRIFGEKSILTYNNFVYVKKKPNNYYVVHTKHKIIVFGRVHFSAGLPLFLFSC